MELGKEREVIYVKAKEIQSRLGDYKLKAVTSCLRGQFKFEDSKQLRKEHFSQKKMNTCMFEIPRSFFEADSTIDVELPWNDAQK